MATLFEQIDALEVSITDSDIRVLRTAQAYTWRMDNPERWRQIYRKYNSKHSGKSNQTGGKSDDESRM